MTQFWSTDSALCERPSPHSYMLMSKVKAEAVPCLQVGFALYKHMHISYHITHITLCIALVNIILSCTCYLTALLYIEIEVEIKIYNTTRDNFIINTTSTSLSYFYMAAVKGRRVT